MSNNVIEKFNTILTSISEIENTEEVTNNLMAVFDTVDNEKLLVLIKFLSSNDFKGKISLANFKKQIDKSTVDSSSLDVYCAKNTIISTEYRKICNGVDRVRRLCTFKKSSFRQLIYLSKMKRRLLYNPQMYALSRDNLLDLFIKFALLEIFTAWKAKKYMASSIVDDLSYKSYHRRIMPTFKSALKKQLIKLADSNLAKYNIDEFPLFVKNISVSNCYQNPSSSVPNISLVFDFGYSHNSIRGSYTNAILSLMRLTYNVQQDRTIVNINLFDYLYIKHFYILNSMFTLNFISDRYGRAITDNEDIAMMYGNLNNDRYFQLNPGSYNSSATAPLQSVDVMKNIFDTIEQNISEIIEDISTNIGSMKMHYSQQFSNVNLLSYFKFLETFAQHLAHNVYYININTFHSYSNLNGIFCSYIKNITFILALDTNASSLRISINNPLVMFMFYMNNICQRIGNRDSILNVSLYPNGYTQSERLLHIIRLLKEVKNVKNISTQAFTSSIHPIANVYNNFLSNLDPEMIVGFDLTDRLLFFRHFSEFMMNPISMIDESFDVTMYNLIEQALEAIDGEANV